MTQEKLLLHIGYLWDKHKNYANKLINKYNYGLIKDNCEKSLILSSWYIKEIENYYTGCSCLEEKEICELIVQTQKLLN